MRACDRCDTTGVGLECWMCGKADMLRVAEVAEVVWTWGAGSTHRLWQRGGECCWFCSWEGMESLVKV